MSEIALRLEHVHKKFRKGETYNSLRDLIPALTGKRFEQRGLNVRDGREFWALQDISFEVEKGEAFGIIGPNGAGKSTMLKLLSRVMRPTQGTLHVNGRVSALIELAAGFHPDLTGRENIYLYGAILGMTRREIETKFEEIVEFAGLAEFVDTPVKRYSSGMYARLGFSVAAHVDPEVLLVDEVLSVGDYVFQQKCIQRMKEVITGGATVLFVSHNLRTVAEFCRRCLLLDRGHPLMIGPVEEVIPSYLNRGGTSRLESACSRQAVVSNITIRNEHGECNRFRSGEKAWIDIEVTAITHCPKLSVCLYIITAEGSQNIFDTSTERLGHGHVTIHSGQVYSCTFELHLNLPSGIFHPSVVVYRYDTQTTYDQWVPATTVYVCSEDDVRGVVHCFPKVMRQEIRSASSVNVLAVGEPAASKNALCSPQ